MDERREHEEMTAARPAPGGEGEDNGEGRFAQGISGVSRAEDQMFGFVRDTATGVIHTTGTIAGEGIHVVRDVATETLHAVGDVGDAAVGTARGLLVGVAGGIRDVASTLLGRRPPPGGGQQPPTSP